MLRVFILITAALISSIAASAPQDYWPTKIIYFATSTITESQIRAAKTSAGNASFEVFKVDQSKLVMEKLEQSVPKSILEKPQSELEAYLKANVVPELKENFAEIMSAKVGAGIASMYGVERIPAVVMDGQYITYGATVREAIYKYQWQKDREANAY
jgi:hypothetical protein